MRRAPARPVRACFVRSCCSEHDLRATPVQCNAKQALSSHFTLRSSHFTLALHTCTSSQLISSGLFSSHSMSCTKHVPVLLCASFVVQSSTLAQTTSQYWCLVQKLAQTTSQYYFVLQSLHKLLPSTTLFASFVVQSSTGKCFVQAL